MLIFFVSLFIRVSFAADPIQTVTDFIAAYNEKNVETMLTMVDPEVRWMFVQGSQVHVETEGVDALQKAMTDYLGSLSYQPHCERTQMTSQGRFVTTVEKCSRTVEGQERAQCSVAVYEFCGNKILNVWYYDAEACDSP